MISFEQILERVGFEQLERHDPGVSHWRQRDGEGRATVSLGTIAAPFLIVNISPDSKTAVYVGTWDNPVLAAMELPQRLKQVYQEILK